MHSANTAELDALGVDGRRAMQSSQVEAEPEPPTKVARPSIFSNWNGPSLEEQREKAKEDGPKSTFVDAAAMKEKVRQNLMKPKYTVTDFYHTTGCWQAIARSPIFEKITLFVIAINALWIAVDTDMNDSAILLYAEPVFIVAENFFCCFFTFEWCVRFMSFAKKHYGLRDAWFVFDSLMVVMMVLETWVFTLVLLIVFAGDGSAAGGGNTGIMRLARLLRLSRMARMAKLLRVMPELMIMIKGMKAACRSVFFTLLLLLVIMYVFGIAFVQLSDGIPVADQHFATVSKSMYTLLLYGILMDNVGLLSKQLGNEPVLLGMFFIFVLIGALTVMNMLVGVLCEVVTAVAATEQEEMLVSYVHDKMSRVMDLLDSDGGGTISKHEFVHILDNVEAVRCLSDVGVDVFALIDLADYIFQDDSADNTDEVELDFSHFMSVVLDMRSSNQATVKDIVDLRKFMRLSLQETFKQTALILEKLNEGVKRSDQLNQMFEDQIIKQKTETSPINEAMLPECSFSKLDSQIEIIPASTPKEDVRNEYKIEGGLSPILPKATPDGQLLTWMMLDDVERHHVSVSSVEELSLKSEWAPIMAGGAATVKIRERPVSLAPRPECPQAVSIVCDDKMIEPLGVVGIQESCTSAPHRHRAIVIDELPKVRIAGDGCVLGAIEVQALQSHVDKMFTQMAIAINDVLNDAILMMGSKRHQNVIL